MDINVLSCLTLMHPKRWALMTINSMFSNIDLHVIQFDLCSLMHNLTRNKCSSKWIKSQICHGLISHWPIQSHDPVCLFYWIPLQACWFAPKGNVSGVLQSFEMKIKLERNMRRRKKENRTVYVVLDVSGVITSLRAPSLENLLQPDHQFHKKNYKRNYKKWRCLISYVFHS